MHATMPNRPAYKFGTSPTPLCEIVAEPCRTESVVKLLDLEASMGIYDSELSSIERGLVKIEVHTVFRIAKALGMEIKDIFNYDGQLLNG